jgi:hypothetical protein
LNEYPKGKLMRFISLSSLFIILAVCSGCSSNRPYTEEDLLRLACKALKERQWEQYANLIVTRADFFLYEDNITAFEEPNTYLGSVIKPEQIEIHKKLFYQVALGRDSTIDFAHVEFCRKGSLLRTETKLLAAKDPVILNTYSLIVSVGETEVDTKDMYPLFTVAYVPWMGQYRILDLEVPPVNKPGS